MHWLTADSEVCQPQMHRSVKAAGKRTQQVTSLLSKGKSREAQKTVREIRSLRLDILLSRSSLS